MTASADRSAGWFPKFREAFQKLPPPKTEESILLRIMVQLMVIIGIIATDVAAQTTLSYWAVPLSILGAWWSWRHRKQKNIGLKFVLAIAMLALLVIFFGNLLQNLNASQVTLAGLLVQLQVLHSFDLPRRKDLGYSMVIGLILLGVAGTLSQTLAFAPWLFLFLAVALPVLVLDYRSRLGLQDTLPTRQRRSSEKASKKSYSPLVPRRLLTLLGITLAAGLLIFALMPRFPGYKIQSFPVSGPGDMQQQRFNENNQNIQNPGYSPQDSGEDGRATQNRPGDVDDTFYYGFNTRINQNLRGQMRKQLVLRVRSQAPGFWKALSFDRYTGQGWEISEQADISTVRRSPWSYRFSLGEFATSMKTESVVQTYTPVMDLPNVIPTLYHPRYLYFPTLEVGLDRNGSLRSPVGLLKDTTYSVVSQVPVRDRTVLQQYKMPANSRLSPRMLAVPDAIRANVKAKAEALLAKADRPLDSPYEIALYLTQALKQNYRIRTDDLPFFGENEDLVWAFLNKYQGGLPDHFSTVLTIMLRTLDIPARLTVGFAPGQYNPFTGYYLVHNTDAYALTEVLFPGLGWYTFDPIPGHDLYPPSIEDTETFGILRQIWRWVAGWLPSPVAGFLSGLGTMIFSTLAKILQWFWNFASGSLIGGLVALMLAIAATLLGWLGWQQGRRWLHQRRLASYPPTARLYHSLLDTLAAQGFHKSPAQTPGEFAQSLREHCQPEQVDIIVTLSDAYTAWCYGGQAANLDYLQQQLKRLRQSFHRRAIKIPSRHSGHRQ